MTAPPDFGSIHPVDWKTVGMQLGILVVQFSIILWFVEATEKTKKE